MSTVFDPNSSKYQIGCGYHVITGMKVVCIVDIITEFTHAALMMGEDDLWIMIILLLICSAITLTPFVAFNKMESKWMLPYLIFGVLYLLLQIYEMVTFVGDHLAGNYFGDDDRALSLIFMEIGIDSIGTILAYRCYQYLCEFQKAKSDLPLTKV